MHYMHARLVQQEASRLNRAEVADESSRLKSGVRDAARREKQLKLAETLRTETDAEARGEDLDRCGVVIPSLLLNLPADTANPFLGRRTLHTQLRRMMRGRRS